MCLEMRLLEASSLEIIWEKESLTGHRADFENVRNFEEYLRGYRIVRMFFNEHL